MPVCHSAACIGRPVFLPGVAVLWYTAALWYHNGFHLPGT
jgi:hypothetical protein